MKKRHTFKTLLFMAGVALFSSCDNGFEELNINPDTSPIIVPSYMFSKAQYDALNNSCASTYEFAAGGSIQHFSTYKDVPGIGDKYFFSQGTYPYDFFNNAYPLGVNEVQTVINAVKNDPAQVNLYAIARIWRAYTFHRITDLYGDIPYSDAAQGYTASKFTPKYDSQQSVYLDMLKELEQAATSLDATKSSYASADIVYGGDVAKWKKFAYSLMLRLSMRMTKVDAATAKTWAQKAIAGGIILDDKDLAKVQYIANGQDINKNPVSLALRGNNYAVADGNNNTEGGKFSNTFISFLKTNKDPRLSSIAVVWVDKKQDTTATIQKGMQNGLLQKPADFITYSEPNINTVLKLDAPMVVISNAEMNFLMAEAIVRGWASGDAASYYQGGISASMRNMAIYGDAAAISTAKINAYLSTHAFPASFDAQMEQIHSQMWVSLFPDEVEVYSNWRRTGYPKLTPVNITGNLTNGTIPRRLIYPIVEENLNGPNLKEAISRQGANTLTTRIWWDKN
ncbi:SusD/RagB family nutrient-binding outer membrane lipoprotein [Flectobacillus rivi]|uniref:SusD/RagB family nutrient-binding outer membrane lipoprotein n=1 Tax=Flectobacillus rivi TaxID=2984209 RepID=A0ABT6YY51_9BACT|nr:SusD/RagB family nutrient-binding outer membrane lipoprotein [Flectobacillus rivi]MDI9873622.1 SusD/RagB family nutrient-binding outer membrane lipoprotein [Flectobacillus rivi]